MAYTTPTTRTTGELIDAADWNTDLVDNIKFLANPPACRVYHNANQSVTDNSQLVLAFNSERYDTDSMHSTVTNNSRITFNTAGLYVVSAQIELAGGTYDYASVSIRLNGTTFLAISDAPATAALYGNGRSVTTVYKFAAADYVEVRVFQDNGAGAARNVLATGNYSPEFAATWVGTGNAP